MMQDSVSQGMDGKADFRKLTMPQLNAILQSGFLAGQDLEDALALDRWGKVRAVKELAERPVNAFIVYSREKRPEFMREF